MTDKKHLECAVVSKQEYDDMASAYKTEIRKLQKFIAKKQVEHDSEIKKVRAECDATLIPNIQLNFVSPENSHTKPPK